MRRSDACAYWQEPGSTCGASRPLRTRSLGWARSLAITRLRRQRMCSAPATRPPGAPAAAVRVTSEGTRVPLPLVRRGRVALGAELHRAGMGWAARAYAGAEVEGATRQTRLNPLDVPTGAYTLLNLSAGL